jgi:hypothetical protein
MDDVPRTASRTGCELLGEDASVGCAVSFGFAGSAPDAERFVYAQRIFEAGRSDWTLAADLLCGGLPYLTFFGCLPAWGWEEHPVDAATRRALRPLDIDAFCNTCRGHRRVRY